jgi:hypothetical protein
MASITLQRRKLMKSKLTILMILTTQIGLASNLMAATGVREDTSMVLVYLFLGMCAMIVIMQLMPALFLLFGMLKSLVSGEKGQVKANSAAKH